jgi:hypothetical protein
MDLVADAVDCIEKAAANRLCPESGMNPLTSEHCKTNSAGMDVIGHVLIVKADALMPQYRDAESQIVKCTHGNGARPDAKGRSIFCKELASNKTVVYYREEIEGIANIAMLPAWARQKLAVSEKQAEHTTNKTAQRPQAKQSPSLLGEVREAAQMVKQRKAERGESPAPKKKDGLEV